MRKSVYAFPQELPIFALNVVNVVSREHKQTAPVDVRPFKRCLSQSPGEKARVPLGLLCASPKLKHQMRPNAVGLQSEEFAHDLKRLRVHLAEHEFVFEHPRKGQDVLQTAQDASQTAALVSPTSSRSKTCFAWPRQTPSHSGSGVSAVRGRRSSF